MAITQTLTLTTVEQDAEQNRSKVRIHWMSRQTGTSGGQATRVGLYYVSANGGAETEYTAYCVLVAGALVNVVERDLWISHNDMGTCTVNVRTYMDTGDASERYLRLNKALTLPTIPRETQPSAATAFIGGTGIVSLTKKNASFTHSLAYTFGSQSGYIDSTGTCVSSESIFGDTTVDFTVPTAWYGEIPNARQGTCTLTCTTYNGAAVVGTPQSCSFAVQTDESQCTPTLTMTAEDIYSATLALTGDSSVLVENASTARCTVTAQGRNSATLVSLTFNGAELSTPTVETDQVTDMVAAATDSRGYVNRVAAQNTVIPYRKPTCNATFTRLSASSNDIHIEATGTYFAGSFGTCTNTLQALFCVDYGTQISVPVTLSGGSFTISHTITDGVPYEASAVAVLYITDSLCTVVRHQHIPAGVPIFDWGADGFALHVPMEICGEPLLDYVIAQGTQNGWHYRKWHSGRMEQWGSFQVAVSGFFGSSGHYLSNETFHWTYPIAFAGAPSETASLSTLGGWLLTVSDNIATPYATAYYKALSLAPASLTACTVTVQAIGTWK